MTGGKQQGGSSEGGCGQQGGDEGGRLALEPSGQSRSTQHASYDSGHPHQSCYRGRLGVQLLEKKLELIKKMFWRVFKDPKEDRSKGLDSYTFFI